MAAFTEIYIDPSLDSDSGAGTVGDPAGDLEWYLEQNDWPAGPTRVNIKAGTDEILAAKIDTALADTAAAGKTVAWVPADGSPLVFQGYTATAGDGGIGGISGGGLVSIINTGALDYVFFIDMHLHNVGANLLAQIDNYCGFINCEIDNGTARGIFMGDAGIVDSCYIHNISGLDACLVGNGSCVKNNYIDIAGVGGTTTAISAEGNGTGVFVQRNIINLDGTLKGILAGDGCIVENNSIYANAGTSIAIQVAAGRLTSSISNNLIEGFSGTGGTGIYIDAFNITSNIIRANSFYNCETNIDDTSASYPPLIETGNETLSASPFTSASTGNFSPVNTGSVKEGSLPAVIGGGLV